jgi:anaerobic selenocysteine-containing dehydrogenase
VWGTLGAMTETKITFCRVCEATCGLEVDVEDNRVLAIRPDPKHVVSRGYACVKGTRWGDVQHSPDRLLHPLKHVGDGFVEISWKQALREIAQRMRGIIDAHGAQSIGHFVGSAGGANVLSPMFRGALWKAMGSSRMYGTGTCDTMNKFRVNEEMYGSPMRLAYPDVDHTDFMLIFGANPAVSGNTLYHLPRSAERFADVVKRGGRVVFVNPRRVETARSGEHLFIRPDTDVYFLAAYLNELIQTGAVASQRVERFMKGYDALRESVAAWTPERQAEVTGISADTLRGLVAGHRAAKGAALYMATGVNQGRSGTLCYWLLESINAVTGNLDHRGGTLMGKGLVDMAAEVVKDPQMRTGWHRDDDLPTVSGQQPSGMLAPDIESGQVRALFVEASNPLLACSNPDGRLDRAFERLELLVSIDLFRNEVGSVSDYVLPAVTWLERPEIPYALQSLAGCTATPYMIYADPVLEAPPDVRHEWWIFTRLADELGLTLFDNKLASAAAKLNARLAHSPLRALSVDVRRLIDGMLKGGGLPGTKEMSREHPHGILLDENPGDNFLGTERVLKDEHRVDLAPEAFVKTFAEKVETLFEEELANRDRMKLIGKREIRRLNTASSNSARLVRETTNYAYLSPADAERIGVANDDLVEVESDFGRIEIPVRVSPDMMPHAVAIPQCWGHAGAEGLSHARLHPGVNVNLLAGDGYDNIEKLSGMSHLSGIPVEVRRVGSPNPEEQA